MAGLFWVVGTIEVLAIVVIFWNQPRLKGWSLRIAGKHLLEYSAALIAAAAAGFAWYQGWVARDTETRYLRSYVMIEASTIGIDDASKKPSVHLIVKNYGLTPVYHFRHWSCAMVTDFPDRDQDFPAASILSGVTAPESLIAPNATIGKDFIGSCGPFDQPISDQTRAEIKAGRKAVFAIGVMKYKDAFGFERETRYRRGWNDNAKGVDGYGGNCADDDCPKEPNGFPQARK